MLRSLTIENFAIIEQVMLDFTEGMTVLSGETGAGKSIIIDALGLLCGGRSSSDFIRQGSDKLVVEGLFSFDSPRPRISQVLEDFGIEWDSDDDLILRREVTLQGKNTVRVNGQLANVQLLKQLGYQIVDIHGQNEHQALLDRHEHLRQLDQFAQAELAPALADYQVLYEEYAAIRHSYLQNLTDDQNQLQRLNFLEFQIQELEQASLVAGEDEALEAQSQRLQNAQTIQQTIAALNELLAEGDQSILVQLSQVLRLIQSIDGYDERYAALQQPLREAYYQLEEVAHQLALNDGAMDDDQTLDEIEARLSQLGQLKRKYGMNVTELLAYYHAISEEVYQIKHREQYVADLTEKLSAAYAAAYAQAQQLHRIRQVQAGELVSQIEQELSDLYMANSRFDVKFGPVQLDEALQAILPEAVTLSAVGFDQVEFYATTNIGEAMKPLIKVASGGELSRFMLALKRVFSLSMPRQTMVFDEIDTGVSGRVAQAIAEKMAQIAQSHQVLCITHLAQVAAIAATQLMIQKSVKEGRTYTTACALDEAQRIEAVAQMLSGKVLTPASLQMAQELIKQLQQN